MSRIVPFGDSALLVVLAEAIDPAVNREVHRLAAAVRRLRAADPRWGSPVPAYGSLLVPYDPILIAHGEARHQIERVVREESGTTRPSPTEPASAAMPLRQRLAAKPESPAEAERRPEAESPAEAERRPEAESPAEAESALQAVPAVEADSPLTIPVRYGGEDGPDLETVARLHGLRPADVVRLHTEPSYQVFMLGFAPGFAYLGPLARELVTPRRATPRPRVPAGSVAIAGNQTGVYPLPTPGGWHLLGRTETVLWDVNRRPPALLRPGQTVLFTAVEPYPARAGSTSRSA